MTGGKARLVLHLSKFQEFCGVKFFWLKKEKHEKVLEIKTVIES